MAYVIGVDCGTSGTKTVLFDEKGTVISSVTIEYPMYQPKNGYAEQDPADWANAMINTIKAVMTKSGVNKEDVAGVGISGQMHGLVMLDKDDNVLRKSIIWCDQRTAAEVEEMNEKLGREKLIKITANPALTGWTAAKILWVKNNEPDIYEKCRHILLPKDYLRFILTGEYATEVSDASGMQLLDVPNRCWSKEVCDTLGIDMSMDDTDKFIAAVIGCPISTVTTYRNKFNEWGRKADEARLSKLQTIQGLSEALLNHEGKNEQNQVVKKFLSSIGKTVRDAKEASKRKK